MNWLVRKLFPCMKWILLFPQVDFVASMGVKMGLFAFEANRIGEFQNSTERIVVAASQVEQESHLDFVERILASPEGLSILNVAKIYDAGLLMPIRKGSFDRYPGRLDRPCSKCGQSTVS